MRTRSRLGKGSRGRAIAKRALPERLRRFNLAEAEKRQKARNQAVRKFIQQKRMERQAVVLGPEVSE